MQSINRVRQPVAIVGISGRFPGGANSLAQLWDKFKAREDLVGEWPPDRWDHAYYHPDPDRPGRCYTKAGAFLDRIDQFDADFFGFSPREASRIDPQQRLLLELAWEALEDGGLVPRKLANSNTAVFIGISSNDYGVLQGDDPDSLNAYSNSGGAVSIAANRLSYFFDFHGPSMSIDTACSSALVAVHEACQAIWHGEASMALAGGVNLLIKPLPFVGFCKASMLSRHGRCRSFDAAADGYVRGEGGVVLVLKPLSSAERDGDPIHGLIVATGVNSDGRTHGLALPSEAAQEALLREVYGGAGIAPDDVFYVEAHGTGTLVGDPAECNAIGRVLGAPRAGGPLYIGSIKSNIGHLEPASGVAGIAKLLLALKHREVPANLHFNEPNPKIPFDDLKLSVVAAPLALPERDRPYLMGVSSFGFGGTNAHVVIKEYRCKAAPAVYQSHWGNGYRSGSGADRAHLLVLSARTPEALRATADNYARLLRDPAAPPLQAICATAALRRTMHPHRLAVLGRTSEETAVRLATYAAGETAGSLASGRVASPEGGKTAFVFCGNGPQWWGMGRQLIASSQTFRDAVAEVDEFFAPMAGWSIRERMTLPEHGVHIERTEVAQPLLFAVQAGMLAMLRDAGIKPSASVGHSVGEIAAAYAAGALSLSDAVRVVYERSRIQGTTAGHGKMAAVGMSAEAIGPLIAANGWLEVAAINSRQAITLAGDPAGLEHLGQRLAGDKVFFRMLVLDYAFHSRVMDPIEKPLRESLSKIAPRQAPIAFVSTVEGRAVAGSTLDAEYWWRNIRQPVQFSAALDSLLEDGFNIFVEIGPHPILRDYINQAIEVTGAPGVTITTLRRPSATRAENDLDAMSTAICACYAHGAMGDLSGRFELPAVAVRLPSYPWQRQTFWNGPMQMLEGSSRLGAPVHPLLGRRVMAAEPAWESSPDPAILTYLADHVVQGAVVFPAAGFIEIAAAAARELHGDGPCQIDDFDIRKALVLADKKTSTLQCVVDEDHGSFRISSRGEKADSAWAVHAVGKLGGCDAPQPAPVNLNDLKDRCGHRVDKASHYRIAAARGLEYGLAFQAVEEIWVGEGEVLSRFAPPSELAESIADYRIHPSLLDAGLQTLIGLVAAQGNSDAGTAYLPVQFGCFRLYEPAARVRFCHAKVIRRSRRSVVADFRWLDAEGRVLTEIERFRFQSIDFGQPSAVPMHACHWQLADWQAEAADARSETPQPETIAQKVEEAIAELVDRMDRRAFYREQRPRSDRLAAAYALNALLTLGAADAPFSAGQLAERGRVMPEHRRLLGRLVEICAEDGFLRQGADGWAVAPDSQKQPAAELWRSCLLDYPEQIAELVLLGRCGENLAGVMRGEINPHQLLFPEKGSASIEHLYDSGPSFRVYNHIAAAAVAELVARWPSDRPLRVLEVGGGTGGLSSSLLPLFDAERTTYLFTDVSEVFFRRTEARLAHHRFVKFAAFDIERDPTQQGFAPGSFDLILAADVLHAASDLRQTLRNIRSMLGRDGHLLLLEKHLERPTDLIFGLVKGWWNFHDHDLRPDSPLLSPSQWQRLLAETGFAHSVVMSDASALPQTPAMLTQHSVFLARNRVEPARNAIALNAAAAPNGVVASNGVVAANGVAHPRRWLILSDPAGAGAEFASAVAGKLAHDGDEVISAAVDRAFSRLSASQFTTAPDAADMARLLAALRGEAQIDEVVHLAGLAPLHSTTAEALSELQDRRCTAALSLIQAIAKAELAVVPRLTLVTRGAFGGPAGATPPDPSQGPLWGLGRVIINEHPNLACRLIDFHLPLDEIEAPHRLISELRISDAEDEVLVTPGRRYVQRLIPTSVAEQAAQDATAQVQGRDDAASIALRLEFTRHGNLDSLRLVEFERVAPGERQVEIRVRAAGLNFRDVMWAMGLLPEEALEGGFAGPTIGMECSGVVQRVGPGVTEFAPGDKVIAFGPSCFASHMVTNAAAVVRMPATMNFESAATVPTAFFTAYYALVHLAHLEPGERVLIHGAAGGVGMAALQIAKCRGAIVFATAGSDDKRDVVRWLGADHVLESRSLAFADQIMALTGGEGVDVILNSLAGEAIWKNLRILRPFGRFLEIGKRDFYANSKIGLRPFRRNLSYFGIDVDQMFIQRGDLSRRILKELMELFARGELRPLPYRAFPLQRASEAFRQMQQSRQIGKLVITVDTPSRHAIAPLKKEFPIRPDATYLVTGGLTGFGLATAKWLVAKGARHMALAGRRGRATEEAEAGIAQMEAAGAAVQVFATDVTRQAEVAAMMAKIGREMPPLRGVVHAAMALDDGIILSLDRERLHRALDPKMLGAWLLHQATLDQPLDFFVLYSSGTVFVGNPGQANYVAGCAYLETLAEYRRSLGLPALAIGWGAISDVGYVARNAGVVEILSSRIGLKMLTSAQAMAAMEELLAVGANRVIVAHVDWQRLRQGMPASSAAPKYSVVLTGGGDGDALASTGEFRATLEAMRPSQRGPAMTRRLLQLLGHVMGMAGAEIDPSRPLTELGIDSLMAVEIGAMVEEELGIKLPTMELLDQSAADLANRLLEIAGLTVEDAGATVGSVSPGDLAAMNEEQVDELLEELIKGAN